MNKKLYIIFPLILIMMIMSVDRVEAEIYSWGNGQGGSTSGACINTICANTHGFTPPYYGVRISLINDNAPNKVIAYIDYWEDQSTADTMNTLGIITYGKNKKTYKYNERNHIIKYDSSNGYHVTIQKLLKEAFSWSADQVKYKEMLEDRRFKNAEMFKSIIRDFKQMYDPLGEDGIFENDVIFSADGGYYFLFEPIFYLEMTGTNKHVGGTEDDYNPKQIKYAGTAKDIIYIALNMNNAFFVAMLEACNDTAVVTGADYGDYITNPVFGNRYQWTYRWSVIDNFLINPYIEGLEKTIGGFNNAEVFRGADCKKNYKNLNNNESSGLSKYLIKIIDVVPPFTSQKSTLIIKKFEGEPESTTGFDGSVTFCLQKCNSDDFNRCSIETSLWPEPDKCSETITKDNWKNKYYKKAIKKGVYRIQETDSNPKSSKVYYDSSNPVDPNSDYWYIFELNSDKTINVYNIKEENNCKSDVKNIFNSRTSEVDRSAELTSLYIAHKNNPEYGNNLVAVENQDRQAILGKTNITQEDLEILCGNKENDYDSSNTNRAVCDGETTLGTIINNDGNELYPNADNYRFFVGNDKAYNLYLRDTNEKLYCSVTYTISTKFANETILSGGFLWSSSPGTIKRKINCYGIVTKTVTNISDFWSVFEHETFFNNLKTPNIYMTVPELPNSSGKINQELIYSFHNENLFDKNVIVNPTSDGNKREIIYNYSETTDLLYKKKWYHDKWNGSSYMRQESEVTSDDIESGSGFKLNFNIMDSDSDVLETTITPNPGAHLKISFNGYDYDTDCPFSIKQEVVDKYNNFNFEVRFIETDNPFPGIDGNNNRNIGSNWCWSSYIGKEFNGTKIGDFKTDLSIDSGDALEFQIKIGRGEVINYGDFNGDGVVNSDDANILFDYTTDPLKRFECKGNGDLVNQYIKESDNSGSTSRPMYSFTLNSSDINLIRGYNEEDNHRYNEPSLDRNNISEFITSALNGTYPFTHSIINSANSSCHDNTSGTDFCR